MQFVLKKNILHATYSKFQIKDLCNSCLKTLHVPQYLKTHSLYLLLFAFFFCLCVFTKLEGYS